MSKVATLQIQMGLRGKGFDPGLPDGLDGPNTWQAAVAYGRAGLGQLATAIEPVTTSMIHQGSARYPVREIVVHCSATRPDWMAGASFAERFAEIRRWHMQDRGWRDIGYHWLIDRDGSVLAGRRENVIGAGVEGHNAGVIHSCLLGGHGSAETDRFARHFTTQQDSGLRNLIMGIAMRTQITTISGHNQYAAKACPGFHVPTWFRGV